MQVVVINDNLSYLGTVKVQILGIKKNSSKHLSLKEKTTKIS